MPIAPIERIEPPRIERAIAPPVKVPQSPVPAAPPAPVERIAPPTPAPEVAPAVQPAPREVPAAPPVPVERVAPPSIERPITPPVERAVRESPVAPAAPTTTPAAAAPASTATPAAPAPVGRETGVPGEALPRPRVGAPDGRDDIFRPRPEATAPPAPPGSAPRLNLDTVRQRAREIATEGSGSRGLFPLQIPVPAERRSKLADNLERAIRPDCRHAYADMGLLAVPALVVGAVADVGCRW